MMSRSVVQAMVGAILRVGAWVAAYPFWETQVLVVNPHQRELQT